MAAKPLRTIITDFDDTVCDSASGQIPKSFWDAHAQLKEQGVEVMIATGRAKRSLERYMASVGREDFPLCPGVYTNGNVIYDRDGHATVLGHFDMQEASEIFEYLKLLRIAGVRLTLGVCGVEDTFVYRLEEEEEDVAVTVFLTGGAKSIESVEDVKTLHNDLPLSLFWICQTPEANQAVRTLITKAYPDLERPDCLYDFARGHMIDSGIGKVAGVRALLERLEIDEGSVVVIGDGTNDITMLEYFEHSVVMGNAAAWIREKHGKHKAPRLLEDGWCRGVAAALGSFGDLPPGMTAAPAAAVEALIN